MPRIALIHGVPPAIAPAVAAVTRHMPEAEVWNLLDDRLITDAQEVGGVNALLHARMERLISHAFLEGADAVMITCSLYSSMAAEHVSRGRPVVGADDAAFREVVHRQPDRVIVVSSVSEALRDTSRRLAQTGDAAGCALVIEPVFVPGALEASRANAPDELADLVARAVGPRLQTADLVLFAQYSLAHAAGTVRKRLGVEVITGPELAARAMRDLLANRIHNDPVTGCIRG